MAGAARPPSGQHALWRHGHAPGSRPLRLRSPRLPGSWYARPRRPPHDCDRTLGALPFQPEPHLSRLLAFSARALLLVQQPRLADHAHSSRCSHVARRHPEGRALPRSKVSLRVFTLQGFGPSVAIAERPPNKRVQLADAGAPLAVPLGRSPLAAAEVRR